jgi:hypothetical protein
MVPYGSGILSFAILPPVVLEVSKKLFFMKKKRESRIEIPASVMKRRVG